METPYIMWCNPWQSQFTEGTKHEEVEYQPTVDFEVENKALRAEVEENKDYINQLENTIKDLETLMDVMLNDISAN